MIVPFESVLRREDGIWKRVVEPMLLMEKSVEVAVPPVVEAMVKRVVGALAPVVDVATSERSAYGEEVEMPTLPLALMRIRSLLIAVPPVAKMIGWAAVFTNNISPVVSYRIP